MSKQYTEIVCILDVSGSMVNVKEAAIEGFNKFVEDQKQLPGKARLTLVLFNHEYFVIYNNKKLKKVFVLSEETYQPRGWTALYDAVGRTVDTIKARHDKIEGEKPGVFVAILTDGHENASKDYSQDKIKEMIKEQEENHSWEFIFLASNIDAAVAGGAMNIKSVNTFAVAGGAGGQSMAYEQVTRSAAVYRKESTSIHKNKEK